MSHDPLSDLFPGRRPVLLDGAMGSDLHRLGWPVDQPTVLANLESPELVAAVHRAHREAGARVLCTNTFGALLTHDARYLEAVSAGVRLAQAAAEGQLNVAGTVAAFGLAVRDPQVERVVERLVSEGVDMLLFETCNSVADAAVAIDLHDEIAPELPCVVCASTTDGGHADQERVREVLSYVRRMGGPQVEVGLNCCRGPHDALRLASSVNPGVRWVKPSTGIRSDICGDDVMAAFARAARRQEVRWIGGCCGTSERTLTAMAAALQRPGEREAGGGAEA